MQCTGANVKRKPNVLTISQKMEILKQFEKNKSSVAALAKTYNIGKQTVRDIVKKKAKLQSFVAKADSANAISDRKSLKGSTFRGLDDAMTRWFLQKRSEGFQFAGPMCSRQAQKISRAETSASSGWLHRFKKRHGIRQVAIQGEKLSADDVAMVEFCYDLENLITEHDLKPEQVYNAEETGLFWKATPKRTLAAGSELVHQWRIFHQNLAIDEAWRGQKTKEKVKVHQHLQKKADEADFKDISQINWDSSFEVTEGDLADVKRIGGTKQTTKGKSIPSTSKGSCFFPVTTSTPNKYIPKCEPISLDEEEEDKLTTEESDIQNLDLSFNVQSENQSAEAYIREFKNHQHLQKNADEADFKDISQINWDSSFEVTEGDLADVKPIGGTKQTTKGKSIPSTSKGSCFFPVTTSTPNKYIPKCEPISLDEEEEDKLTTEESDIQNLDLSFNVQSENQSAEAYIREFKKFTVEEGDADDLESGTTAVDTEPETLSEINDETNTQPHQET
ncbi:hypothetical protein NQ318_007620, partial [Aromia moschata]